MSIKQLKNYINGEWVTSKATEYHDVMNPALDEPIAQVPLSTADEANEAVAAAKAAFWSWRTTPPITRARYMFRLKQALEENFEELAQSVVMENGKTIDEARGEVRRTIENVEVACGIPSLMMGYNAEDVAQEIDSAVVKVPLGVVVHFAPFNFPAMVPYWFIPYAIATGNTVVLKPSSQTPITQNKMTVILDEIGLPPGVVNLVNGSHSVADALMENPDVKAVTFVGSTPVGKYIYKKSCENGKRVIVQGGAKNALVVMPDCNLEKTVAAIVTSACGCAGERCLAGSLVLAVGNIYEPLKEALTQAFKALRVGYGLNEDTQMGPVISKKALNKIVGYIDGAVKEGGKLLTDGRGIKVEGYPNGYFVGPTLIDNVTPDMTIAKEEVFGPVLGIIRVNDLEECYEIIDNIPYGNAASIFTQNGKAAREFQYRVEAGNIGINIGIAAPIAFLPFGGMRDSFFGVLHGQGQDAINFFTDSKVVITRWL